jgi:UDP-GlcNAc:undecaprenyl-phosphate GlcNAc-1-phosphate transferase
VRIILGTVFTLAIGLVLTFAVRAAARRFGIVAPARADRWHKKSTAMLGGVGIYIAFVVGYFIFSPGLRGANAILMAGTLLFITGLVDDLSEIKPYAKLIIQLIAAATAVYFGLRLPWTQYQAVNDCITIFWLVGITNAINLLDNMDGLAAGVSVISCGFLVVTFLINGQTSSAVLPALLAGAAGGFLLLNFHPATIFMGDCGSMFLGFSLGGMALMSDYGRSRSLVPVLFTPVLILLIPIFDTCVVTLTRKLSGRPISQGGRDHTSHRLVALGMSERRAVLMLYMLAALSGVLALMVRSLNGEVSLLLVPGFALSVIFLGLYLGKVRIYAAGEQPQGNTIISALSNFSYKRRVFEVLSDVVLVALAYYSSYLLRWDGNIPPDQMAIFMRTLPVLIVIQMSVLLLGGTYRGLWRYVGFDDLLVIVRSGLAGTAVSSAVVFAMYWFRGPSRAVFLLDMLLMVIFVAASRLSFRLLRALIEGRLKSHPDAKPVFIYGADDGADLLVRVILGNPDHRYVPVAFIDDDARKTGRLIHGFRIFGSSEVPRLIRTLGVSDVLISNGEVPESKLDGLRNMGLSPRRMCIRFE